MSEPVAQVDVDSTEREQHDQAGGSRRRVAQPSMGRGSRTRIVPLELGGYEYDARSPKLVVWSDMATIIEEQAQGSRAARRSAGDTDGAGATRVTTDRLKLTSAVTHFLRGCLSSADWSGVEADLADPDNDIDLPDLWAAGLKLIAEFRPDMEEQAKKIGMRIPEAVNVLAERYDPQTGAPVDEPAPKARKAAAKTARRR